VERVDPPDGGPSWKIGKDLGGAPAGDRRADAASAGDGTARLERAVAGLTPTQRQAVLTRSTAVCVQAGAGSGKTRVLALRVAVRLGDGSAGAEHTAVCTFTRKAAGELRQRLQGYGVAVARPATDGAPPGPGVRVGTLHQFALSLLRRHALDNGRPLPLIAERPVGIVGRVVGDPSLAPAVAAEIGWAKARGLGVEAYAAAADEAGRSAGVPVPLVTDAYRAYQRSLERAGMVDLDDVLARATALLEEDEAFSQAARWRYRHLSIDEFQDVNPAQFRFFEALRGGRGDLFAVGDPDQAIYGWNGADPGIIERLPSLVPGMESIRLSENHRSTPQIVAAAAAALGPEARGAAKATRPDGVLPVVTAYDDERAEAEGVATALLRSTGAVRPWSDHAVLARTNDQLLVLASTFRSAGIPVVTVGGPTPAGRPVGAGPPGDAVELTTFHRAKGLEWPVVHVVGVEDGFVPIVHATSGPARSEERRLLYVALTRARDELSCSWARRRRIGAGPAFGRAPSPWLADVARLSQEGRTTTPVDASERIARLRAALSP
jgi:superfamily I DNA/RNA helicase